MATLRLLDLSAQDITARHLSLLVKINLYSLNEIITTDSFVFLVKVLVNFPSVGNSEYIKHTEKKIISIDARLG